MNIAPPYCLKIPFRFLPLLAGLLLMPGESFSTELAADNASNPAYAAETGGAWKGLNPTTAENPPGMDNGGTGFLPWDFAGGYHAQAFSPYGRLNHFIDGVDFASSSFNNLGAPAFALTNSNQPYFGYTARATRPFSSPLAVGDRISVDFDNPLPAPLANFDSAGFLFRLNTGGGPLIAGVPSVTERFGFFVTGDFNNDNWTVTDASAACNPDCFFNTGVNASATTSGSRLQFTLTSTNSYVMEVIRLSDGHSLFSRAGMLLNETAGSIDALEITLFGNGSGDGGIGLAGQRTGEREFFFNNLRIEHVDDFRLPLGDYNGDGLVDAADYVVWRQGLNKIYTQEHYQIWSDHFGQTVVGGILPNAVVPEPASAWLFLSWAGVAAFLRIRIASRIPSTRWHVRCAG